MRKGIVYLYDERVGIISEDSNGVFRFEYDRDYAAMEGAQPVSLTLPIVDTTYESDRMFPFFDGLIPEGWLLDIAQESWKLNPRDRMGLLLACCRKCIGAASVVEVADGE